MEIMCLPSGDESLSEFIRRIARMVHCNKAELLMMSQKSLEAIRSRVCRPQAMIWRLDEYAGIKHASWPGAAFAGSFVCL